MITNVIAHMVSQLPGGEMHSHHEKFSAYLQGELPKKLKKLRALLAAAERRKNQAWCFEYGDPERPGAGLLRVRSLPTLSGYQNVVKTLANYRSSHPCEIGGVYFDKECREDLIVALRNRIYEAERSSFRNARTRRVEHFTFFEIEE